jgi:uncharacterized membrane protein
MNDIRELERSADGTIAASRGLGWFSVGLGLGELAAPGHIARLVGVRNRFGTRLLIRAFGAREVAAGLGLFSQLGRPGWFWSRFAGDLMDLAALGTAMFSRRTKRLRAGLATAAVLGVTAVDAWAGQRALQARPSPVRRAITIGRPRDEVYDYWRDLGNLPLFMMGVEEVEILEDLPEQLLRWRARYGEAWRQGEVRFVTAPDGSETEVHLTLSQRPKRGARAALRSIVEPVVGTVLGGKMEADLGRLKQLMETGDVARSDASIHPGRHVARPPAVGEQTGGVS